MTNKRLFVKFVTLILVILFIIENIPVTGVMASEKNSKNAFASLKGKYGEHIFFGHYEQDGNLKNGSEPIEWEIKDILDGKALFVSTKLLDVRLYDGSSWKNSGLRKWLNDEFLNAAFTKEEAEMIETSDIETISEKFNKKGELDVDKTKDKIFVPSYEELVLEPYDDPWTSWDHKRFSLKATEYAKANGLWVSAPDNIVSSSFGEDDYGCASWYLRDGHRVSDCGYLDYNDIYTDWIAIPPESMPQGVRPAFWAKIPNADTVTGLSKDKLSIKVGETVELQLKGDMHPTFSSSDDMVADVSKNGSVFGYNAGKVTITVSSRNGIKFTCKITVKASETVNDNQNEYDSQGRVIKGYLWGDIYAYFEYDKNGNVLKETDIHANDGSLYASDEYVYDKNNHPTKKTSYYDGSSWTVNYEYYKDGTLKKETSTSINADTGEESVVIKEYDEKGRIIYSSFGNNLDKFTYYKDGSLKTHYNEYPDDYEEGKIVTEITKYKYSYYKNGSKKQEQSTVTDKKGNPVKKYVTKYDKKGNTTQYTRIEYNGTGSESRESKYVTKYKYFKNGKVKEETEIQYENSKETQRIVYLSNNKGEKLHTEYAEKGRETEKYDYNKYTNIFSPSIWECWWG